MYSQEQVEQEDTVVAITISTNGYHLAVAHQSGAVRVWDLRKMKSLVELNTSESSDGGALLKSVTALAFHEGAKYLAYGGEGGIHITMIKEWKVLARIDSVKVASGMVWAPEWIASCSSKNRTVTFHGPPTK